MTTSHETSVSKQRDRCTSIGGIRLNEKTYGGEATVCRYLLKKDDKKRQRINPSWNNNNNNNNSSNVQRKPCCNTIKYKKVKQKRSYMAQASSDGHVLYHPWIIIISICRAILVPTQKHATVRFAHNDSEHNDWFHS